MRKTSIMLYPFKITRAINRATPEMLSAAEILSALMIKGLVVEQGRFLKRKQRVWSCKFQQNCKLYVFALCYALKLDLRFSETFAESNFETADCESFLQVELLNCMLLKPSK